MQIKIDKTILLVAATKALAKIERGGGLFDEDDVSKLQRIVDILSNDKSRFILSLSVSDYEHELVEEFLEDV